MMKKAKTVIVVWWNGTYSNSLLSVNVINSKGICVNLFDSDRQGTLTYNNLHEAEHHVLSLLRANNYELDYYQVGDTAKCYNWQWINVAPGFRDSYKLTKWVY